MIPILKDKADQLVITKASKVGVSELLFVVVFAEALQGHGGMYVLPTDPVRNRLVAARIDPCIGFVPLYQTANQKVRHKKSTDNLSLKKINHSFWNFVGSRSPENFYEFEADFMIYDELDKCNLANLELAKDRTGAAKSERGIWVGNPSIADFGIDAKFKASSAQEWMLQCPHCNEWQQLDWWQSFVVQDDDGHWSLRDTSNGHIGSEGISSRPDASAICHRCSKPIDRLAVGEWVAVNSSTSSGASGYHTSRLFGAPGNDFDEIRPIIRETFDVWNEAQGDPTKLQVFYNNRLGLPFEAEGSKITDTILQAAMSDYMMPLKADDGTIIAGVDVGARLHVHISRLKNGLRQKLWVGSLPLDPNELQLKCAEFKVSRGVIDAQPERHLAEQWCKHHAGWYRCYYSIGEQNKTEINIDHVDKTVAVNRTASIDQTYAEWMQGYVSIGSNWRSADGGDFAKQMKAPTRIYLENKRRYEWQEGNQPDHHFHADNYERITASMLSSGPRVRAT